MKLGKNFIVAMVFGGFLCGFSGSYAMVHIDYVSDLMDAIKAKDSGRFQALWSRYNGPSKQAFSRFIFVELIKNNNQADVVRSFLASLGITTELPNNFWHEVSFQVVMRQLFTTLEDGLFLSFMNFAFNNDHINMSDARRTVLHYAVTNNNEALVKMLCDYNIHPNIKEKELGTTPLMYAVINNKSNRIFDILTSAIFKYVNRNLKDQGVVKTTNNMLMMKDMSENTAFDYACLTGNVHAIKYFLGSYSIGFGDIQSVEPQLIDEKMVIAAVLSRDPNIVKMVLDAVRERSTAIQANIDDASKLSPLKQRSDQATINKLIVDMVNIKDDRTGRSPLFYAVMINNFDIFRLLFPYDGLRQLDHRDSYGKRPADYVVPGSDIARFLADLNANRFDVARVLERARIEPLLQTGS